MTCHMGHNACKLGSEVEVGDLVYILKRPNVITSLRPYEWYDEFMTEKYGRRYTASIAETADGRGATIEHHSCYATEL